MRANCKSASRYLTKLATDVNPDSRTPMGQKRLDQAREEAAAKAKKKG